MADSQKQEVDLLIERGVVLPMTGEDHLIWDGAVAVDGGRVVGVGATAELRRAFDARETIDARE
jgi:predicted amidohydrolase YtcJ